MAVNIAAKQQEEKKKSRASFLNYLIITVSLASRNCSFQILQSLALSRITPCTVMDVKYNYRSDHLAIYINIQSLCCIPETKIFLYANYTSIKKKKRHQLVPSVYPPSPVTQINHGGSCCKITVN